jgi:hypothetical protein
VAERATVFETTLLGVETTPGTPVSPVRRLQATGFLFSPQVPVEPFVPMGSKSATTAIRNKEWTEGEIEGVCAFNDLIYLLSGVLTRATPTTPSGATLTRRWNFKPENYGPDDPIIYTAMKGSSVRAEQVTHLLIDGLTVRFTREEASVSGAILAQETQESVTISAGRNEVQLVTKGTHTGGTFTLTFEAQTTGTIDWDASAAEVQTALEALSNIAPGDVIVTGDEQGPWTVTFTGALAASNRTQMTIDGTLLTGGAGEAVTTVTQGQALANVAEVPIDPDIVSVYMGDTLANEAQIVTVQATGGTFALSFADNAGVTHTTAPIAEAAAAATVETALLALACFVTGDVTVTGGAGGPWTVAFGGRYAGNNQPMLVGDGTLLTGITVPAIAVTQSVAGGLSKLLRVSEFEWNISDRFTEQMTLDDAEPSFSAYVEREPEHTLQMVMQYDAEAAALMATLRAKDTKFLRLECWGPVIEGDFRYRARLTVPVKFTGQDQGDSDDVYTKTFDATALYTELSSFNGFVEWEIDAPLAGLEA